MTTATSTDTEVLEQIHNQEAPPCQIITVTISTTTYQVLRPGAPCPNPAEYTTLLHDITSHEATPTDMCGECYRDFIGKHCPNPACDKPRLVSSRPI